MARKTHELERFLHSNVYAVLGFGAEPIAFAEHLMKLSKENPAEYALLHDITDRVAFVNRLRFETGWEADYDEVGNYTPGFSGNLDALETYLLCTCADALANAQSPASFLDWVKENHDRVCNTLGSMPSLSPEAYVEATADLYESYEEAGIGLTRNFIGFFVDLPSFLRKAVADTFVLIKGAIWDKEYRNRLDRWNELTEEKKIRRIASHYLYGIRRSEYTHLSRWHRATSPGHWRRLAAAQGEPGPKRDGDRWHYITFEKRIRETKGDFYRIREDYKVEHTLFAHEPSDESFLLRAVIAISVLRRMLHYLPDEKYLQELLKYYAAREAIYAFLYEMRRNRDHMDFLVSPEAILGDNNSFYLPVNWFSTYAGKRLLEDFSEFVELLKQDIGGYLHWLDEVNSRIAQFNADCPPKTADRQDREPALVGFSQELYSSHEVSQIRWYRKWIYPNLKRHVESGQVHYSFGGILLDWSVVWQELRQNLAKQPPCPVHPKYPHVSTLAQGVINDVVEVREGGIIVQSHRTLRKRFIPARQFEVWWNHLLAKGPASLTSRSPNIPRTGHARVVGAIMAACLPDRIRVVDHNTIELIQ